MGGRGGEGHGIILGPHPQTLATLEVLLFLGECSAQVAGRSQD